MKDILTTQLAQAGSHYGYSKSRRSPSMKKFVGATQSGTDFINLTLTADQLILAKDFLKNLIKEGKQVLFVGEKPEVRQIVREKALGVGEPYMVDRFVAGTITNFGEIRSRAEKLADMLSKKEKGEYAVYTKKEQLMIQRTIDRMDRNFGGILSMAKLPGALIVVDPRHEHIAVAEAKFAHIPVIAIASTDCDIASIEFPIVANDASNSSVRFILDELVASIKEGGEKN